MAKQQDDMYYKGYIAGYRDGIRDAAYGKTMNETEQDIMNLPVRSMNISMRAYNCLIRVGCSYVADIAVLSGQKIAVARGLGPKTASEIARWLDDHGICYTERSVYL